MSSTSLTFFRTLVLAFLAIDSVLFVDAALFVIKPSQGSTCHGGQACTIEWLDDGESPLLPAIGACTVGLFSGKQQLVQTIQPVDVSSTHSVTFTPNPKAGPDSDTYYISIASTTFKVNGTSPYLGFSPFFKLDNMSGSFASPVPSLTTTIPVPATSSNTQLSTITVGTLQTSLPPITSLVATTSTVSLSSSRFTTSAATSPASSTATRTGTGTNAPASTPSANAARARTDINTISIPLLILGVLSVFLCFLSFS